MNNKDKPNLVIIAGPNGAGKSTVADFLMLNQNIDTYINADVIAKGLAASKDGTSDIVAGRVLLEQIDSCLSRKESFAFESTMSGMGWKKLMLRAKKLGYENTICYVAVNSVDISIARVRKRVLEGGHNIPEATLRRRFGRSLSLFFATYKDVCENWYFFDNSGLSAVLAAYKEFGENEIILKANIWTKYERRLSR